MFSFKKSFRLIALALSLVVAFAALAACSGGSQNVQPKQADLAAVYELITSSGKIAELTKVPERDLYEVYGIEKDKLKQWAFGLSENYSVDAGEVALFEANDASYVDTLVEKLQKHIENYKNVAKGYSPDQAAKLEPVQVTKVGNFVYLVVGEDYNALMQILKDNIG